MQAYIVKIVDQVYPLSYLSKETVTMEQKHKNVSLSAAPIPVFAGAIRITVKRAIYAPRRNGAPYKSR